MDVGRGRKRVQSKIQNTNTQIHRHEAQIQKDKYTSGTAPMAVGRDRGKVQSIAKFKIQIQIHKYTDTKDNIQKDKYTSGAASMGVGRGRERFQRLAKLVKDMQQKWVCTNI